MSAAIETRDLTVYFGPQPGVVDLNLTVEKGEIFGFVGPNGAGKTTTIRLMLDLLRPDRGTVRVMGRESRNGGGELRANVGYLPGDLALFPGLSGRETLDLFAALQRRKPTLQEEVIDRLGFDKAQLGKKIRAYSTGMRQAIGVTIALQHDPELLVLDEPTSGLDPIVRDAFIRLLIDLRLRGRTIFLSSHVLDEVERCADRVGFLAQGRLHLVESVGSLRASRPRMIVLRYGGREDEVRTHQGDVSDLIEELQRLSWRELVDLEIHPASLDQVFQSILGNHGKTPSEPKPFSGPAEGPR